MRNLHSFPLLLLLVAVVPAVGCTPPCSSEGIDGLSGFDLDCDGVQFLGSGDVLNLTMPDLADGQIDLEMYNTVTLGPGLRFGEGGDYTIGGRYHDSATAVADVDGPHSWVEILEWEGIEGEAYGQLVAFEFHIEVDTASTFPGGEVDGSAIQVPVFTVQ